MAKTLTERQKKLLDFIIEYTTANGFPPSIREMASYMGIKSPNGVMTHLRALEKKGYIQRSESQSRGIVVKGIISSSKKAVIPVVGRVIAGSPVLSYENIEEFLPLDPEAFGRYKNLFGLRVYGDSMKDAGIIEGDIVIVAPEIRPSNGDIVVADIDNETTVKYFYRLSTNTIKLVAANKSFADIYISDKSRKEFRIIGKVVGVIRRLDKK